MATINNAKTIRRIIEDASIQLQHDQVPKELASKVVPVLVANPRRVATFNRANRATNSTGGTIYTCSAINETYLTAVTLGVIKDATSQSLFSSITCVPKGSSSRALIEIPGITLTAQSEVVTLSLNPPILLEKSSTITMTATNATGNIQVSGTAIGYETEGE